MDRNNFYNDMYNANIMPNGMLNPISYQNYALMMIIKDQSQQNNDNTYKPEDIKE